MTTPIDPITAFDLDAFVDDQLPPARRIEVASHLAADPAAAARVMADIARRDALCLAFPLPEHPDPGLVEAAGRLAEGLVPRRPIGMLRRIAAVLAIGFVGWAAHGVLGPLMISDSIASARPPDFVEDARRAHQAALARSRVHDGSIEAFDADEIRAATAITLPVLPAGWRAVDLQIFPSTYGPSVEMTLETERLGPLSLFAVRPGDFAVTPVSVAPVSSADGDAAAVYWQMGEVAYALTGGADGKALAAAATEISNSLY
ncbi:anti-sigma factor family protein [Zavarzinia aquatilis]|uniref:Fis family transcriptional regulator n=1 Tax=Zavarzinia aquatilis TaxID=2211142 RepID=A0A317EEQ8_9PROT|nr:Fis family transcriptional regulator [Zavarzinia aquatilis]PWR25409.1 Fis family transcriptional regulator [Zavarzinia aquatilis]